MSPTVLALPAVVTLPTGTTGYPFCSLIFVHQITYYLSHRTSYLITLVFSFITAAVIAEVCSASPSAGSIYLWAAEAGGPKYGRLLGFVVAWWSTTAWTTFCASNTQAAANYMLSVGHMFFLFEVFLSDLTIIKRKLPCSTSTSLLIPTT